MSNKPRPFSYYDLIDASSESGCPLCRIGQKAATRHLEGMIFDSVNSISLRETLRQSYGYCHEHAWQLPDAGESAPLGIAIVHRDILNTLNKQLDASSFKKSRRSAFKSVMEAINLEDSTPVSEKNGRYLNPSAVCPACERYNEMVHLAYKALLEYLEIDDERLISALKEADGFCLPHLREALNRAPNQYVFEQLINITRPQLTALIAELDEYIRKRDHRFRGEPISTTEEESWQKALARVSGAPTAAQNNA